MIKSGRIVDNKTGAGIPYASIELTDYLGTYLGVGANADSQGYFTINSLMIEPGTFMRISSVGYQTTSYTYEDYVNFNVFTMVNVATELEPVVITAPKKDANKNVIIYGGLGLLALMLLLKKR